jgi:hypothetical protein
MRAAQHVAPGISRQTAIPGTRIAILYPSTWPTFITMRKIFLALFLAVWLVSVPVGIAQTPDLNQEAKLLGLIKEVQKQQAQLAENQAKIEEKIAAVSDIVKDARLYSKRVR